MSQQSLKNALRQFEKRMGFVTELKWFNIIAIILYHIVGVVWFCIYAFPVKWQTVLFAAVMYVLTGFGVTGGAHRLWTHRAYKANLPLKIFLLACFSASGQNSLQAWVRDHRLHHKFSDTDADPHNATRGLFFSHIGWLMMKKHPQVLDKGKTIDMSDIYEDPLLRWHRRHFTALKLCLCFVLPTALSVLVWAERWQCAVAWQCFARYLIVFHSELSVNSFAHTFGYKPYCKSIRPAENSFVSVATLGEGWHNYHHAFPWDYKAAEISDFFNFGTHLIDFFAAIGWASELRQPTPDLIYATVNSRGDGSHPKAPH